MSIHYCSLLTSLPTAVNGIAMESTSPIRALVQCVCIYSFLPYINFSLKSQIKKEFFGALRIRKVQDARNPMLATTRPATTVYVYDAVKTRMDEALRNARRWEVFLFFIFQRLMSSRGLIPAEDAPDIIANTFLAQLSDETLKRIRYGFLDHRECKYLAPEIIHDK